MKLNQEEIKQIIPHRHPFLFIEEMVELRVREYGIGRKTFRDDDDFFKGHFPEKPVVPGVILIESMAQVGAVVLLSDPEFKGKLAFFTGIKNAKFRKSVFPGDTVDYHCEIHKIRGAFGFGHGKAFVNGELVCECEISFAVGS
ncbi:MAG: 3-hydroxyacyl-ACP dehydratase FabZ [Acholeplasmataceae bacterium]|nr:3-hydroxyacyl-ACP dehydratase FabZ [Acholeplasmataceae bacterium]